MMQGQQGGMQGVDTLRYKSMLENLQQKDRDIESLVAYSKFVVAYLLQQDGANPGWRKADIEGPVYLVKRRTLPRFQLMVKNQYTVEDLVDSLHKDWELDCQKNYVFYKVEDVSKKIRGLWFHDDTERQKLEGSLEKALEEIRNKPAGEPQTEPQPRAGDTGDSAAAADGRADGGKNYPAAGVDSLYEQFGLTKPEAGASGGPPASTLPPGGAAKGDEITVTREGLRRALHEMIDSDEFLDGLMRKLRH